MKLNFYTIILKSAAGRIEPLIIWPAGRSLPITGLGGACSCAVGLEYLNVRVLTYANSLPATHTVPLCFSYDSRNYIDSVLDNINGVAVLMESMCVFCEI